MRKFAIAVAMLGLIATAAPSQADGGKHDVTFTAGVPCAVACPYWLDTANTDVEGDGKDEIYFNECNGTGPYTEGATGVYDDIVSHTIPTGTDLVILEIFPAVDFDSFICESGDTWDGDGKKNEVLAQGANILGENCDNPIGPQNPVPAGCREKAQINAKVGKKVIFRVYNWSDVASTPGTYTFKNV